MGNDGGSIPKRRELVKEAARNPTAAEQKESQQEQEEYYWTTDPISNSPLGATGIVSDCNGRLYNKESIVTFLLPSEDEIQKTEAAKVLAGAVKSLKDVVEVKFTLDAGAVDQRQSNGSIAQKWVCPLTDKPLGPGSKAVYLVPCGHAFSGSAFKEVDDGKCQVCTEDYAPNDVITIVPTSEIDIARLTLRMKTLKEKGLSHSLKKASKSGNKKRKKHTEGGTGEENIPELVASKREKGSGIKNSATASLTAKVLAEQDERNKRRKMDNNSNISSLFSTSDSSKPSGKSSDFMTRGFSIPGNNKR